MICWHKCGRLWNWNWNKWLTMPSDSNNCVDTWRMHQQIEYVGTSRTPNLLTVNISKGTPGRWKQQPHMYDCFPATQNLQAISMLYQPSYSNFMQFFDFLWTSKNPSPNRFEKSTWSGVSSRWSAAVGLTSGKKNHRKIRKDRGFQATWPYMRAIWSGRWLSKGSRFNFC